MAHTHPRAARDISRGCNPEGLDCFELQGGEIPFLSPPPGNKVSLHLQKPGIPGKVFLLLGRLAVDLQGTAAVKRESQRGI